MELKRSSFFIVFRGYSNPGYMASAHEWVCYSAELGSDQLVHLRCHGGRSLHAVYHARVFFLCHNSTLVGTPSSEYGGLRSSSAPLFLRHQSVDQHFESLLKRHRMYGRAATECVLRCHSDDTICYRSLPPPRGLQSVRTLDRVTAVRFVCHLVGLLPQDCAPSQETGDQLSKTGYFSLFRDADRTGHYQDTQHAENIYRGIL